MLIPNLPAPLPVKWLKRLGIDELRGGLKVEDFDYMHVAIYIQEVGLLRLSGRQRALIRHST